MPSGWCEALCNLHAQGHETEALHLMSSYLPKESGPGSGYTEGGGLYALGLIHANHGAAITDYLLGQLKEATNEVPTPPFPGHRRTLFFYASRLCLQSHPLITNLG